MGKNLPANAGDTRYVCLIPGLGRSPGEGNDNPLQFSCLENPHGQKSLAGYSPWCCNKSDMTEQLSTAQHKHIVDSQYCVIFKYTASYFLKNCRIVLQNAYTILHSYKQHTQVSISIFLHSCSHLLLSIFFIIAISVAVSVTHCRTQLLLNDKLYSQIYSNSL